MKLRFCARTRAGWPVTRDGLVVGAIAPFGKMFEIVVVGYELVTHRVLYMGRTIGWAATLPEARGKLIEHFADETRSLSGGAT